LNASIAKELVVNDEGTVRLSWLFCAIGAAVMLGGLSLFVYTLFQGIFHLTDDLTQIVVPGGKDLALKPKINYTIFLETESVVDGRVYSNTEGVAGLTCVVTSQKSGNKMNIHNPNVNTTYSVNGRAGHSALEFGTEEAGLYHIACDYPESSQGPQAVLAVGVGVAGRIFSMIMKSLASFFGGVILGGGIIAIALVMRDRAKKRLAKATVTNQRPISLGPEI
jgi:hypothetical protein